jgi:anti-anti-sigma factor
MSREGKYICVFSGKLDTGACAGIESAIQSKLAEPGAPVVFDLAGIDYISSAFLRICLKMGKQSRDFSIVHVDPSIKKVFMIAGFDRILRIE